jgi:hypothetical protein
VACVLAAASGLTLFVPPACAGSVTLITHGLDGNTTGWITGLATNIPNYYRFQGANFACYRVSVHYGVGAYYLTTNLVAGSSPASSDSGQIILELDWSELDDGDSHNTCQIAGAVAPALLDTNFIGELGGHALAEFPLHLIGHSRGGSLVCELSRLLGTNGVWVDHITTLDPHPLNDPDFPLDALLYSAVDAPANTYENILFHDNYWQNLNLFVHGKAVSGAYVRKLTSLGGGYSSQHSDVHLWYHGTVDLRIPTSDTEAPLTITERTNWWTAYESAGVIAGFNYSLIGGAERTSADQPVGAGFGMIRDGYNQRWDLGAGTADNRTTLATNNGAWPNLIQFNRAATNQVAQGQVMPVTFCYQWAQPDTSFATISLYLDDDWNPLNTNQMFLGQIAVPGNGAGYVSYAATNLTLNASSAAPGLYAVLATISGGGRTRHLYAPQWVEVIPAREPPTLDIAKLDAARYRIGINGQPGQTVVLQSSIDLQTWSSIATNTLVTSRWLHTNAPAGSLSEQYYRGMLLE